VYWKLPLKPFRSKVGADTDLGEREKGDGLLGKEAGGGGTLHTVTSSTSYIIVTGNTACRAYAPPLIPLPADTQTPPPARAELRLIVRRLMDLGTSQPLCPTLEPHRLDLQLCV
jgi:hypothetical protein